jgi:hypothetical protein
LGQGVGSAEEVVEGGLILEVSPTLGDAAIRVHAVNVDATHPDRLGPAAGLDVQDAGASSADTAADLVPAPTHQADDRDIG